MHVIVICVTEREIKIRHKGTQFIQIRNMVAEHKLTKITNKR